MDGWIDTKKRITLLLVGIVLLFSSALLQTAAGSGGLKHTTNSQRMTYGTQVEFFQDLAWEVSADSMCTLFLLDDASYVLHMAGATHGYWDAMSFPVQQGSGVFYYRQCDFQPGKYYYVVLEGNWTTAPTFIVTKQFSWVSWVALLSIIGIGALVIIIVAVSVKKKRAKEAFLDKYAPETEGGDDGLSFASRGN